MKTGKHLAPVALMVALTLACSDGTEPEGFTTEQLSTQLAIAPGHFHAWETEGTFTVSVTDPDGNAAVDFDLIQVERRQEGAATWGSIALTPDGDVYVGTHRFEASGAYELRVTGLRPSDEALKILFEAENMLHVIRPHPEVGGYRVEFETFPGHIHAGETSTITFWVMEVDENGEGVRPPVAGLSPTIWVQVGGSESSYPAVESEPGVYTADHEFSTVGATVVGIRLIGTDQAEHEGSLEITVHQPHG